VGALVGSANFVDEVAKTKGNTDSGFNGAEAYGLNDYLDTPQSKEDVKEIQKMYKDRLVKLFLVFEKAGLKRACETDAGFFMLFHAPDTLNGESVKNAEDFNMKMIEQTGIIGVPFD
jgi:aspartate/methionine/tyrosine aminotransferase